MDKKKSSILNIVLWSIVAVLILIVLSLGILNSSSGFIFGKIGPNHRNNLNFAAGNGETSQEISSIDIEWVNGSIIIDTYDGDTVTFKEDSNKELSENKKFHYSIDGSTLTIEYASQNKMPISVGSLNGHRKDLTIMIPRSMASQMKSIDIETVSSDIDISNITTKYIDIETVSGSTKLNNIIVTNLELESISGDTIVNGSIENLNYDSMSGNLEITSDTCPDEISTDTISGDITIYIPENNGFTCYVDGLSSEVYSVFPTNGNKETSVYGNGNSEFNFDSLSGDISICKLN